MEIPLTPREIQEICDEIPLNRALPPVIANNIRNGILQPLVEQLKRVRLFPAVFKAFKERIVHDYYSSLVAPGEAVGIQMASAIGEKTTQLTLGIGPLIAFLLN